MVDEVVAAFGDGIQSSPGVIDRARLAAIVFANDDERTRLNGLMHPAVGRETLEQLERVRPDAIVIVDVPLLVETHQETRYEHIVVVEAPLEVRLTRLVERGMTANDAVVRIRAQASDEQRRAVATWLIQNDGNLEELRNQVAKVWNALHAIHAIHTGPATP